MGLRFVSPKQLHKNMNDGEMYVDIILHIQGREKSQAQIARTMNLTQSNPWI